MGFITYNILLSGGCSTPNSGVLNLSVTGQSPPFSIVWNDPVSGATFSSQTISTPTYSVSGLSAGTYSFILYDSDIPANSSSGIVNFYITSSTTISIGLMNDTLCGLNNGALSAYTEIVYSSSTIDLYKDGEIYQTKNTSSSVTYFTGLPPGIYYAKSTNNNGCIGISNTLFIRESSPLDFGLYTIDSPYCYQGTGKVFVTGETGTPPYKYIWSNVSGVQTASSVSNLVAGNYGVTVQDFFGCTAKKVGTVNVGQQLNVVNYSTTPPSCFEANGSLSVILSGGTPPYAYNLSNGASKIITSNQATFSNLTAGNYTLSITDAGLCNILQSIYLSSSQAFSVLQMNVVKASCQQLGKILISLGGGFPPFYYSITNSEGVESRQTSNLSSTSFSELNPGIYTITIQDSFKNCTYTEEVEIGLVDSFTLSLETTDTVCGGRNGGIVATVTPSISGLSYVYSLSNGFSTSPTTATTYTFSDLFSGPYTVSVVDSNNCTNSEFAVVQTSAPYQLSLLSTTAYNNQGGTVTAIVGNVYTKFNLVWSSNVNGQTGPYLTGLTAGTYSVTLSGSDGCQQFAQTTVPNVVNSSTTISYLYSKGSAKYTPATSVTLQTMMFSGFTNLTQSAENCVLSSATFTLRVTIDTDEYLFPFYTTKSFNKIPSLTYFAPILQNAVLSIPYIETCVVDATKNTISVTSQIVNGVQYYKDETITFDILIYFNIKCLSINDVICP